MVLSQGVDFMISEVFSIPIDSVAVLSPFTFLFSADPAALCAHVCDDIAPAEPFVEVLVCTSENHRVFWVEGTLKVIYFQLPLSTGRDANH